MVKVAFPFHVLHGGHLLAPHKAIDATEVEAEKLIALGAKVIEKSSNVLGKVQETKSQVPTKPQTAVPQKKR